MRILDTDRTAVGLECPGGSVLLVRADDPAAAPGELARSAVGVATDRRALVVLLDRLPAVDRLVDRVLDELAAAALAIWPDWYGPAAPFAGAAASTPAFRDWLDREVGRSDPLASAIDRPWLRAARVACLRGRPPRPREFATAVAAEQLILALGPGAPAIVLVVADRGAVEPWRLGLARSAEWLAARGAGVLVVAPPALIDASGLDRLGVAPIDWPGDRGPSPPAGPEEETHRVWPVAGRPHPYSPGEQLLAARLARDAELGPLFGFNQRVRTSRGSHYFADLLWEAGRLVVEVDGYRHHGNRLAFSQDRHRDYELMLTGYLVLRLPHDEVIDDVELALDKIRDLVRFRRPPAAGTLETAP